MNKIILNLDFKTIKSKLDLPFGFDNARKNLANITLMKEFFQPDIREIFKDPLKILSVNEWIHAVNFVFSPTFSYNIKLGYQFNATNYLDIICKASGKMPDSDDPYTKYAGEKTFTVNFIQSENKANFTNKITINIDLIKRTIIKDTPFIISSYNIDLPVTNFENLSKTSAGLIQFLQPIRVAFEVEEILDIVKVLTNYKNKTDSLWQFQNSLLKDDDLRRDTINRIIKVRSETKQKKYNQMVDEFIATIEPYFIL